MGTVCENFILSATSELFANTIVVNLHIDEIIPSEVSGSKFLH